MYSVSCVLFRSNDAKMITLVRGRCECAGTDFKVALFSVSYQQQQSTNDKAEAL
jgi:hypothetical protein